MQNYSNTKIQAHGPIPRPRHMVLVSEIKLTRTDNTHNIVPCKTFTRNAEHTDIECSCKLEDIINGIKFYMPTLLITNLLYSCSL